MKPYNFFAFFAIVLAISSASCGWLSPKVAPQVLDKMRAAYASGNFFQLSNYLQDSISARSASAELQVFRAANHNFFNRLNESEAEIKRFYTEFDKIGGNDTLRFDLTRLQLDNALKQQRYNDAANWCDSLTQKYAQFWSKEATQSLVRLKPIVQAVGKVVPMDCQKIVDSEISIGYDKQQHPKIPVAIGKFSDEFSLDLSTQFCMVAQSVAKRLELTEIKGSFQAQSTLGNLTQATIAVAPELKIGNATLHNVPFLVFPDKAMLLRGDSTPVHGTLGYGVLAALHEVVFTANNRLLIPKTAPSVSQKPNFGLMWYTPIVQAVSDKTPTAMRLDLSLRRSTLHVDSNTPIDPLLYFNRQFEIGSQTIKMDSLKPTAAKNSVFIKGAFGRDLMRQAKALRINFQTMQIALE
jgi:Aspartyl protease